MLGPHAITPLPQPQPIYQPLLSFHIQALSFVSYPFSFIIIVTEGIQSSQFSSRLYSYVYFYYPDYDWVLL